MGTVRREKVCIWKSGASVLEKSVRTLSGRTLMKSKVILKKLGGCEDY